MVRACVIALAFLGLAACGGGGGGGGGGGVAVVPTPTPTATPTPTPTATTPAAPTWTQNVFQAASAFKNLCATVRTGSDILGDPFPDKAGTLQHELFWLRSWTRETYLWNTEVSDQNPANFTDRIAYFNTLKTSAAASSGKPKDQFHFALLTSDYLAQVVSAPLAGYGAEIRIFAGAPPRDVRVIYTQAGTPAAELLAGTPKLGRGAKLLMADGIDVVNGGTTQAQIDTLNNATFPRTAGETHTFTVQYPNGSTRSISLTSAAVVEAPVNRTAVLTTPTGPVGYMLLNTFSPYSSEKAIADAIASLKSSVVTDLVIDLRYNGGGLLAVASQLGYQVAGATATNGKAFERLQFNTGPGGADPVTGRANTPTPFYSTGLGFSLTSGTVLPTLNLPRVFILSTSSTCSASEAVINGLRGVNVQVVLIGGTTCGKPYGFLPADNCGETYFSIQFQGVNEQGFGDYPDGFAPSNASAAFAVKIPGCSVADNDYGHELGDGAEGMLAAALAYRATGTCSAPVAVDLTPARVRDGPSMETSGRSAAAEFLRNNRDLHMPGRTSP